VRVALAKLHTGLREGRLAPGAARNHARARHLVLKLGNGVGLPCGLLRYEKLARSSSRSPCIALHRHLPALPRPFRAGIWALLTAQNPSVEPKGGG
jgi:hypothetical protein